MELWTYGWICPVVFILFRLITILNLLPPFIYISPDSLLHKATLHFSRSSVLVFLIPNLVSHYYTSLTDVPEAVSAVIPLFQWYICMCYVLCIVL